MNSETTVKGEVTVGAMVEKTAEADREYRQPEVHDLGKLEQVQGLANGFFKDYSNGRFPVPI